MTPEKYRTDPLFPRIETAVLAILKTKNFVAPIDVLVPMASCAQTKWKLGGSDAFRTSQIPFHLPNGYQVHQKPTKNKVTSNNDQPRIIRQTPEDASASQTDEEIPF